MNQYHEFVLLILCFFVAWMFWESRIAYPIKIFVTLLHEVSHGLAVLLTKGKVEKIQVRPDLSGSIVYTGGYPPLVHSAGYLGSVLLGFLIFLLPLSWLSHYSLVILGLLVLLVTLIWVRDKRGCGLIAPFAIFLIGLGILLPQPVQVLVTRFLGIMCVMYSFIEVRLYAHFVGSGGDTTSDAIRLEGVTRIPAKAWAISWQVLSLVVFYIMVRISLPVP